MDHLCYLILKLTITYNDPDTSVEDFPGGPVAKTLSRASSVEDPGLIPGRRTRSHMPQLRPGKTHQWNRLDSQKKSHTYTVSCFKN